MNSHASVHDGVADDALAWLCLDYDQEPRTGLEVLFRRPLMPKQLICSLVRFHSSNASVYEIQTLVIGEIS